MDLFKKILLILLFLVNISTIFSTSNVIDISINENVAENVLYNPLQTGNGSYFDSTENQKSYNLNGEILIKNNHLTEAISNIKIYIINTSKIYNLNFSNGRKSFYNLNSTTNILEISIPELGALQNSTISYLINTTNISPPINFTTSYSKSKIFAGQSFRIEDKISNTLNSSIYSNNCIYDINITQKTLSTNQINYDLNFTYDNSSLTGLDSTNATFSIDNRSLNWKLKNFKCLNSNNYTNISYIINSPKLNIAKNYKFINSTIKYKFNDSISQIKFENITGYVDNDFNFEKKMSKALINNNATWKITSSVINPTNIDFNLTKVTLWVSIKNASIGTNPNTIDKDTISNAQLIKTFNINKILNSTNNTWFGTNWVFNYSLSTSPIVWMNTKNHILDDGIQILNSTNTITNSKIYEKEIFIATGYWIKITKNITRLLDNKFNIKIGVKNIGTSTTPSGQVVIVYNFLPNNINLTSNFDFSNSTWYNTTNTSQKLIDKVYNGTMHQFALIPNNFKNASLDSYTTNSNLNNSWSVNYNVSGINNFKFNDLFLTGVDPLNVEDKGSTISIITKSSYNSIEFLSNKILFYSSIVLGSLFILS